MKFYVGQKVMISKTLSDKDNKPFGTNNRMYELQGKIVTIRDIKPIQLIEEEERILVNENPFNWAENALELIPQTKEELFKMLVRGIITDQEYDEMK